MLQTLPDTPERTQQELSLQLALGGLRLATHGFASPEAAQAFDRARKLCEQTGNKVQVFPALFGLVHYHAMRAEHQVARELADQLFSIAQDTRASDLLIEAHYIQGNTLAWTGEYPRALTHLERGSVLYNPQQHRSHASVYGSDPGIGCRAHAMQVLWLLGYPDQALTRAQEAVELTQALSHANSVSYGLATADIYLFGLCACGARTVRG